MNTAIKPVEKQTTKANIPYSLEAEQAVLGALMLDNRSFDLIVDVIYANLDRRVTLGK